MPSTFLKMLSLLSIPALALSACDSDDKSDSSSDNVQTETKTLQVSTSFYPLAYLVEVIGGSVVTGENLLPAGNSPHFYEPTVRQVAELEQADLFIYHGQELDPYAEKLAEDLSSDVIVMEITSVESVEARLQRNEEEHHDDEEKREDDEHEGEGQEGEEHADDEEKHSGDEMDSEHKDEDDQDQHSDDEYGEEGHDGHAHGEFDPHIWLDPTIMLLQADAIRDKLSELRPNQTDTFNANFDQLEQDLKQLDSDYQAALTSCAQDGIIVSHDAYGYLAARYNIEQHPISGLSPDQEPSTRTLAELTDLVEEQGIQYVMGETLYRSDLAELIAEETGAEVLVLSPIASLSVDEEEDGETYLTLMRRNLEVIQTGMECEG